MYEDNTGKYKGEAYAQGGAKYQGASGLNAFNQDFGTNFSTWNLKYFNWSLSDDYDSNPVDYENNDPNRIPYSDYSHGGMMPTSGAHYIAGGFDAPRKMKPGNKFWDLWNLFRETMVHHFVKDIARWASEAGIPQTRWYSHQIPGDYLFGTNPDMPNKNARYYTSASPLWTADIAPYGSPGATIYDIKFPDWFARSTQYGVPAISAMSKNWAIMEYDAETYPSGFEVTQGSSELILEQYMNIYKYNVHLVNFWRWWDESGEHRIKGMNKEAALKQFIEKIRDKARRKDLNIVFDPPKVIDFSGKYETDTIQIQVSGKIWKNHPWEWKEWGNFSHFEIFRGEEPSFSADDAHLLCKIKEYVYYDSSVVQGKNYYYKIRAVNSLGVCGPLSKEIKLPSYILDLKAEEGGTTDPAPGIYNYDPGIQVTITAIPEIKFMFAEWSGDASGIINPINIIMNNHKSITAHFSKKIAVYPPLNFTGTMIVNRSLVQAEYIHLLTWDANPQNTNIVKYTLYEAEEGDRMLIQELDANTFEYKRRWATKNKEYIYELMAVNDEGVSSEAAKVTIR